MVIVKLGSRTFDERFLGVSHRTYFFEAASSAVFAIFVLVRTRSVFSGAKGIDVVFYDVSLPLRIKVGKEFLLRQSLLAFLGALLMALSENLLRCSLGSGRPKRS